MKEPIIAQLPWKDFLKSHFKIKLSNKYDNTHASWSPQKRTDTPQLTKQLHSGRSIASWLMHKMELIIHMVDYVRLYMAVYINLNSKTPGTDWLQLDWPGTCYWPAVFFCYLCFIALSLPPGKLWCAFQKLLLQYLLALQNCVSRKSTTV